MQQDPSDNRRDHSFGQEVRRPGERRTLLVIAITVTMMVVEILAGLAFSSMALLADGLHMASHSVALGIAAFAYVYARRHAYDPTFTFGTGKVNALGGFAGAMLLAAFAVVMAAGSADRFIHPAAIVFDSAITVAALGLVVNGVSAVILGGGDGSRPHHQGGDDHNLRSAYLHVLADALTSVLAIVALLVAKYAGLSWMDPAMGIVGAVVVARWSVGLMRSSGAVLVDRCGFVDLRRQITAALEAGGDCRVTDLHLWCIGPGLVAAEVRIAATRPLPPGEYKARMPRDQGLVHVTVEVHQAAPGSSSVPEGRGAGRGPRA